jgi:hypothetical protein
MPEAEMAVVLIAIIVCLGVSLVWALFEIEQSRRRSRSRAAMVRDATRHVKRT